MAISKSSKVHEMVIGTVTIFYNTSRITVHYNYLTKGLSIFNPHVGDYVCKVSGLKSLTES